MGVTPIVRGVGEYKAGVTKLASIKLVAGSEIGDLHILFIESGGLVPGETANLEPNVEGSGWELWKTEKNGNTRLSIWKNNTTTTPPTVTDTGDHQQAITLTIKVGTYDPEKPFEGVSGIGTQATTKSVKIPSITTIVSPCLIVGVNSGSLPDATTESEFSAWADASLTEVTERIDRTTAEGDGGAIGVATGVKATGGTTGEITATAVTEAPRVVATIAIRGLVAHRFEPGTAVENDSAINPGHLSTVVEYFLPPSSIPEQWQAGRVTC